MSYISKRVSRKKKTTAQEIVSDEATLSRWMRQHTNTIVYGTGAVLLVLVIILGLTWMKKEKTAAADSALSHAMALYQNTVSQISEAAYADTGKLNIALDSLDKVVSDFSGTPQGEMASLFKANVLFRLGKYEEAIGTIQGLKAKSPKFATNINAYYLLARCYEAMKDYKTAIETYETAKKSAAGDMVMVIDTDLARCYELSGDKDAAIEIYEDILSKHPDTLFATRAQKKLAILGITDQETS